MSGLNYRVLLIDGNAVLHRTYNALNYSAPDRLSPGLLVHSVLRQCVSLAHIKTPSGSLARNIYYIVWDSKDSSYRRQDLYSGYKANRKTNDLIIQTRAELLPMLDGVSTRFCLSQAQAEADDIIYLLCEELPDSLDVVICSGDEDLLQCMLRSNIYFYSLHKKKLIGRETFISDKGFDPEFWPIYKAIVGDTSDNWPGVRGVGPKTFYKWMSNPELIAKLDAEKHNTIDLGIRLCKLPFEHDESWVTYIRENITSPYDESGWQRISDHFKLSTDLTEQVNAWFN